MLNPIAIDVYRQTVQRLDACARELINSTHMVAYAQTNLTVDTFEGQDHLAVSVDELQMALKRFKTQLAALEAEYELEPEYSE